MKRAALLLIMVGVVVAVLAVPKASYGDTPVVLELFTSQGCSSCPPADALLRKIASDPELRGKVIPLAFHVDYWNHLGWRDPFSSRQWTIRQSEYIRAMKLNSAYTPQIVVNGAQQMVGSSANQVYRAIEEESKRKSDDRISLRKDGLVRATSREEADLIVIVFENGAVTNVKSGENEGKTLANDAIVRKLHRVGTFRGTFEQRVSLELGARLGAVALLQDAKTRRITAASRL